MEDKKKGYRVKEYPFCFRGRRQGGEAEYRRPGDRQALQSGDKTDPPERPQFLRCGEYEIQERILR